jgi:hypothetical protein
MDRGDTGNGGGTLSFSGPTSIFRIDKERN